MFDLVIETILKAGNFIYFIFLVSIYAWFLIIKKYFLIKSEMRDSDVFFKEAINYIKRGAIEKLISLLDGKGSIVTESLLYIIEAENGKDIDNLFTEKRIFYYGMLEKDLGTIGTLSGIAPLLGLLGTVSGMMATFSVIKLYGSANPALMADGISEALLTTQAGLVVSFPIVLAGTYLKNRVKDIKYNFEKIYVTMKRAQNV